MDRAGKALAAVQWQNCGVYGATANFRGGEAAQQLSRAPRALRHHWNNWQYNASKRRL
jgi:hypothetical protein